MTKEFRFALFGCGGISRVHREQIAKIDGARLVAVADISEANASAVAAKADVDWYTDYQAMLARDDIDIVNIVTPSATHADAIVAAARAGKHVIVEKPVDIAIDKAEFAIAACRKAGVKLAVVSQHRFDDSTIRVKREIDSGKFGKLFLGQAAVNWYRAQSYYDRAPWSGTWAMDGGGVLMIQALHTIDVLQYLMGPVKSVFAHTLTATHDRIEVEDVAVAAVTFANGAIGTISGTTSAYPGLSTRLELFGELGTAVIEDDKLKQLYFRDANEAGGMFGGVAANWAADAEVEPGQAHRRQFEDMLDAIREDREPLLNGEESLQVLKLILAMYKSAQTGEPVDLYETVAQHG
ncbi:Gfo/Idh/MocA family protein [Alicyclobacillus fodiniaquatilis]|uniref:Gfo/Idh/MocA family protein n=1 Tax=Alicyclobacillus fodiniaquatilis TaxID=1661150 RepID=A0ABW4JDN6_9BACL